MKGVKVDERAAIRLRRPGACRCVRSLRTAAVMQEVMFISRISIRPCVCPYAHTNSWEILGRRRSKEIFYCFQQNIDRLSGKSHRYRSRNTRPHVVSCHNCVRAHTQYVWLRDTYTVYPRYTFEFDFIRKAASETTRRWGLWAFTDYFLNSFIANPWHRRFLVFTL